MYFCSFLKEEKVVKERVWDKEQGDLERVEDR